MKTFRQYILIIVATLSMLVMPEVAFAGGDLSCDGSGGISGGNFYDTSYLCSSGGIDHILSQIMCYFLSIQNNVLGKLYCGIQWAVVASGAIAAVLTVYVAIFGVQLLSGMATLNAKEIISRLIKIGIVYTFATNSTWGIQLAFDFFVAATADAVSWVINGIGGGGGLSFSMTPGDISPIFDYLDYLLVQAVTGPFTSTNSEVIGFFAIMSYTIPPIFMIAMYCLWTSFSILVRSLVSFMVGLSAIAFLIALSPIFMSFMLFQSTFHFFESWIRFMMSFSLQIVVIFAILTMWLSVLNQMPSFFNEFSNLIFDYQRIWNEGAPMADPTVVYGICPYDKTDTVWGPSLSCDWGLNNGNLIPPSEVARSPDFLYYLAYRMGMIIMIAYTFNVLLKHAPQIAKDMVGPNQVPALGGQGWGNLDFGKPSHLNPSRSGGFGSRHDLGNNSLANLTNATNVRGSDVVSQISNMAGSARNRPLR